MAKNHTLFSSASMMCWDVDALNHAGVYAAGDLDNGTLVTLKKINHDSTSGAVKGFEYIVEPAKAGADNVFVVDTPEVGYTIEMQMMSDPRYFYNEAGRPMSIRAIMSGVDVLELSKEAFVGGTLPTQAQIGQYVAPAADGKYAAPVAGAPASGAYFKVEGLHSIACGNDIVPTVLLRCMANQL